MAGSHRLGLSFAFASSAADACHEATQKAMVSCAIHPELSLSVKSGIIGGTFLASFFHKNTDAWSQFMATFRNHDFLMAWAVSGAINVSANFLMIVGMRRGQISDTVPFLSLSPIFLLASGYIFIGESMDVSGMLGVATVAFGGLWLSRASMKTSKVGLVPEVVGKRSFIRAPQLPPGADVYIFIALIQSISSAFDKRGVRAAAAPVLYGGTISLTVSLFAFLKFLWLSSNSKEEQSPIVRDTASVQPEYRQPGKFSRVLEALPSLALTLFACSLKMVAYWCQLKANELIFSAQLSAIRKSGMLLVLLLGRFIFNEEVASKWLPVSTMLVGVGILAAV